MSARPNIRENIVYGTIAGLIGGFAVGGLFLTAGILPGLEGVIQSESIFIGIVIHFIVSSALGIAFAFLVLYQSADAGETLFWGMIFGIFWWFFGPMTMVPLLFEGHIAWNAGAAQEGFGDFLGHVAVVAHEACADVTHQTVERNGKGAARFEPLGREGRAAGVIHCISGTGNQR